MRPIFSYAVVGFLAAACLSAQQVEAPRKNGGAPCQILRPGFAIPCPAGWTLLDENEREVVISNFQLEPGVSKNTRSGKGKATIAVSGMPSLYRDLAEWVFAGHKNAPDAVERKFVVKNTSGNEVSVTCLFSPETSGPVYSSYFFQIGKSPVLVELSNRADDPKRGDYESVAKDVIASAKPRR